MIEIFIACLVFNLICLVIGNQFYLFCFKDKDININFLEKSIFGIIILSFVSLTINFFFPISKLVGTLIVLLSLIILLNQIYLFKIKKNVIFFILSASILSFFLIVLSNVNRPDAGLYHLPYISLINENKILIGSSNIHFRFGHISIIQYLSAINNNHLFSISNITVPIASITSIFLYYAIKKCFNLLKNNKNLESFIIFLIIIFSFYSFNRYSNYGNDSSTNIYFFILLIYFLELNSFYRMNKFQFYKISYLSIFLFSLKTFMVITLIIPFLVFIFSNIKKSLILNKNFAICSFFLISWIIKNILVSGCAVYPLTFTCFKDLKYYNNNTTVEAKSVSEAWSKGWSDQTDIILSYDKYNKNFNWINTWKKKHFIKILEKFSPFIIFSFLLLIFFMLRNYYYKEKRSNFNIKKNFFVYFIFINLFLLLWFLKFPLYRYGLSFIVTSYIFTFILVFRKFLNFDNKILLKKTYQITIFLSLIIFLSKNGLRIIDNFNEKYYDYPWPQIYSLDKKNLNKKPKFTKILINNKELYYYSNGELCMYSKSPCSNYYLKDLNTEIFLNYNIYWINN